MDLLKAIGRKTYVFVKRRADEEDGLSRTINRVGNDSVI